MKFLLGFITGIITGLAGFFAWAFIEGNKMTAAIQKKPPVLKIQEAGAALDLKLVVRDLRSGGHLNISGSGKKILFLNFWELWCSPCRMEMPSIDKLYQQVKDSNIVFAIISKDKPDLVKNDKALKEFQLPFYHLENILPPELDAETVPRTIIIDKEGRIIVKENGMANWHDRKVIRLIDSLKAL